MPKTFHAFTEKNVVIKRQIDLIYITSQIYSQLGFVATSVYASGNIIYRFELFFRKLKYFYEKKKPSSNQRL